jgi:hypothetical protein
VSLHARSDKHFGGVGNSSFPLDHPVSTLDRLDQLALGVRIALDVALRGGEAGVSSELLHVAKTAPGSETIRAARVMKVWRPECELQPDSSNVLNSR